MSLYDQARQYALDALPEYVATLDHHRAKALFRLGKADEAIEELSRVVEFRRAAGDLRGMIKAQHEIAKVLQEEGSLDEAEQMYHLVLLGAETEQFERLLPAPLYQLCLLELQRNKLESATLYQSKCSDVAQRISDPLWQDLAELAEGMIAYRKGDYALAASCVESAINAARMHGFSQVVTDAKDWIRETALSVSSQRVSEESTADFLARFVGLNVNKAMKALRYATEIERIRHIQIEFQSDSDVRTIRWLSGEWSCDCKLFLSTHMCSHILALMLMGEKLWRLPEGDKQ